MTENQPVTAQVLPSFTPALFDAAVKRAVELLRAGELVALPTETVYGLAANAFDTRAVAKIFEVKGRPKHNPVIVHVASFEMAKLCVTDWPLLADKLAKAHWPGPLTLVLPRSREIPDSVTAGGATVGVRWPNHPFFQAVIRACGFPLAAPSANLSTRLSPTNAQHVLKNLGGKIQLIVDGGQSQVGIESTVVDLTVHPPCVLRPGIIREESLTPVTTKMATDSATSELILKSPGSLAKHYSPNARLVILSWHNVVDLNLQLSALGLDPSQAHVVTHTHIPSAGRFASVRVIPRDAEVFARGIYAELHRCDDEGARLIVIEALPEGSEWRAIADRLSRAAV